MRVQRPRRRRGSGVRFFSPAELVSGLALVAAAVTVALLTLDPIDLGSQAYTPAAHRTHPATARARPLFALRRPQPSPAQQVNHPRHRSPAKAKPAPTPSSAPGLQARGHALLQAGQYASAIPVLKEAMKATGENPTACAQPTDQNCLTYAFALYDLGHALQLSGNPAAAVPILEQRIEINVARPVVAQELSLAQSSLLKVSPSAAGGLEGLGHDLLQSGQYASAIPVLQRATKATGENPGSCAQPTQPNCLTYAFALYDLGRALRLNGDAPAAVAVLKQRLRINNQPGAVTEELQLAQSAIPH
jgi:tetratricopeptide (TPR) repeat protein